MLEISTNIDIIGRLAELGVVALILGFGIWRVYKYFTDKEKQYIETIQRKDDIINEIITKTIENQIITNETLKNIKDKIEKK